MTVGTLAFTALLAVVVGRCSDPRLLADVALRAFCFSTGLDGPVRTTLGVAAKGGKMYLLDYKAASRKVHVYEAR